MDLLLFTVASSTSETPDDPFCLLPYSSGWSSGKFPAYPQELVLEQELVLAQEQDLDHQQEEYHPLREQDLDHQQEELLHHQEEDYNPLPQEVVLDLLVQVDIQAPLGYSHNLLHFVLHQEGLLH